LSHARDMLNIPSFFLFSMLEDVPNKGVSF